MREALLKKIEGPRILETHGGKGELGRALYLRYPGVVFEKDPEKTPYLVESRPHWSVYEADCVAAMRAGVGFHHEPNFIDCDPYGSPWETLRAVFVNAPRLPRRLGLVVTDGLGRDAMFGRAWASAELAPYARRLGNAGVRDRWEDVVRDKLYSVVEDAGYAVTEWLIRRGGYGGQMTHYAAVLEK